MKTILSLGALLCLGLVACGGSESKTGSSDSQESGGGGGDSVTPLAPPADGVQVKSQTVTLKAGEEKYLCWSSLVPEGKDLEIEKLEPQTPQVGVHHYAVFTNSAPLPKNPDAYDCTTMGISWGLVSGGGIGTGGVTFPKGTAMEIDAGTHLILQLHLLNTTGADLVVEPARVNLDSGPKTPDLQPVGLLIAGTLQIDIPPHSTDAKVEGGCPSPFPLEHIFAIFPHMHQLGRHISADIMPANGGSMEQLNDQSWNFGQQGVYPVTGSAKEGDQVKVTCSYDNATANTVKFGLTTEDEMCLEVLYYYPATTKSQYCGLH